MRFLFLSLLTLTLTACGGVSGIRDTIGLNRAAPDEFQVIKNAPLEVPPSLSQLPPPRPGAPRPQERAVSEQARSALLGGTPAERAAPSATETALLQQVGTDATPADIRATIDAESVEDPSNQSVTQRLLGFGNPLAEDESVLDPEEELQRLKNERGGQ